MTFTHGRHTVIIIDGVNLSAFTDNTEEEDQTEVHDVTTYGAARKAYAAGLGDGTFTIGGTHDNGVSGPRTVLKALKAAGDPVPFQFRTEGTGTGLPEEQVDVIVKSYKQTNAVADMVKWTCELQMTGALAEIDQA